MHLLDNDNGRDDLRGAPRESAGLRIPSMDQLDVLEAQSIYIFREAFAGLKELALPWSLGQDLHEVHRLDRQARFGPVPFPAPACGARQQLP